MTTQGGATDFARLIEAYELFGPYCLIGDMAVNCYVEPVYTLDVEMVLDHGVVRSGDRPDWAPKVNFAFSSLPTKDIRNSWRGPERLKSWGSRCGLPHM